MRALFATLTVVISSPVLAATAPVGVTSPLGGNGHNVTFDGQLFVVATGEGWVARALRAQAAQPNGGTPDMSQTFSPPVVIQPPTNNENALALCEETPQPTRCTSSGAPDPNGSDACYDLWVIDSDALAAAPNNTMRRRRLSVRVSNPGTAQAAVAGFSWTQAQLQALSPTLRGIEPSVTRDGKLLVWQGHPNNSGSIDTMVYSVNTSPCAATGWTAPKSISAMNTDPLVSRYKLADRPLRDPAGVAFTPGQLVYGGYPWIFPDGEAITFTAVNMPCRTQPPNEDPPGCGPRRNALSVLGYPTNWQVAHIDGAANPDTDQTVRLFFTSPGPMNARPLPFTRGVDVWPFFGSNTSNYVELVFDDGLDGRYAGFWHLNEFVTAQGAYDRTHTADSSGYSNTGSVKTGATFPLRNNGALGKALVFDGLSGRVEVPHSVSLSPVNAITVEMMVKPRVSPDCDGNNNYRLLLGKSNINGAYSLVLEDDLSLQARVRVAGGIQYDIRSLQPIPIAQWTHVAFEYDAATGTMAFLVNGVETNRVVRAPALLQATGDTLYFGAPGSRSACPANGDGAFDGELDEVAISRIWRFGTPPMVMTDAGVEMDAGVGGGTGGGAATGGGGGDATGGGAATGGGGGDATGGGGGAAAGGGGGVATGGGDGGDATGGGSAAMGGGGGDATGGGDGSTVAMGSCGGCGTAPAWWPVVLPLVVALGRRRR
ncbi:MAG: LamG domain-containing protein [Myxococcota bacterium]